MFNQVDPTYPLFDDTVKLPDNKTLPIVDESQLPNNGFTYASVFDLYDGRQTAEALLPTIAISCLRLNSTSVMDRFQMQTVFSRVYFFNRAKLLPFPILRKNGSPDLTPQAKSYLNGKRLMDLLSPSVEAFVRFVLLVDLMRYHHQTLEATLHKYLSLFSSEDRDALVEFMNYYKGPKNEHSPTVVASIPPLRKVIKGYRSHDIALFSKIKKQVVEDRQHALTILLEMNAEASKTSTVEDDFPANRFDVRPFIFHFRGLHVKPIVKVEHDDNGASRKRKKPAPPESTTTNVGHLAMDVDDTNLFDYGPIYV